MYAERSTTESCPYVLDIAIQLSPSFPNILTKKDLKPRPDIGNSDSNSSASLKDVDFSSSPAPTQAISEKLFSADDVKRRWRAKQLAKQQIPSSEPLNSWLTWLYNITPKAVLLLGSGMPAGEKKRASSRFRRDLQSRRVARVAF